MNSEYILYLDLDGVLTDAEGGYIDFIKDLKNKGIIQDYNEKDVILRAYAKDRPKFWAKLDWIPGGEEVYKAAKDLFERVYILSSTGQIDPVKGKEVELGKRTWVKKNLSGMKQEDVIIVMDKNLKSRYSDRISILIDDIPDTIYQWNKKGGYGILHNFHHYYDTIETLKEISDPIKLSEIAKRLNH